MGELAIALTLVTTGVVALATAAVAAAIVKDAHEDVAALVAAGIGNGRLRVARHERRRSVIRIVLGGLGVAWSVIAWSLLQGAASLPLEASVLLLVFGATHVVILIDTAAASLVRRRLHAAALRVTAERAAARAAAQAHTHDDDTGELRVVRRPR